MSAARIRPPLPAHSRSFSSSRANAAARESVRTQQALDRRRIEDDLPLPGPRRRQAPEGRLGVVADGGLEHQAALGDFLHEVDAGRRGDGRQQGHGPVVFVSGEKGSQRRAQDSGSPAPLVRQLLEDLGEQRRLFFLSDLARRGLRRFLRAGVQRQVEGRQQGPGLLEGLAPLSGLPGLESLGEEPPRRLGAEQPRDVELDDPPGGEERAVQQRVGDGFDRCVVLEAQDLGVLSGENLPRPAGGLLDEELDVPGHQDRRGSVGESGNDLVRKDRLGHEPESNADPKKGPRRCSDGGPTSKGTLRA